LQLKTLTYVQTLALVVLLVLSIGVVSPYLITQSSEQTLAELQVTPGVILDQYSVVGDTAEKIRAELDQRGPKDQLGNPRDAFTEWLVSWSWPDRDGRYDYSNTKVTRNVTITVPRWESVDAASRELQSRWNIYLTALLRHEQKHLELVDAHYQEIPARIKQAYEQNNELTEQEANAIAGEVLAKIRRLDREYDETTNHGRREGVKFP
jgi:predicted secreted Zn-dependent protease